MEAAGFVIGLAGLISVFDKACEIWRAIGAAKDFGEDVEGSIRKLEIEFFRFHSWWIVIERLELRSQSVGGNSAYSHMPLATHLSGAVQNPIITVAESILSALIDIQGILADSGVLEVLASKDREHPAKRQRISEAPGSHRSPGSQLKEAAAGGGRFRQHLLSAIPWRKRVKHDATPWRESHKERLDSKIQEINHWNHVLYSILPNNLRESILRQGISSYVLADVEEVEPVSRLKQGVMSQQAKLFEANKKLEEHDYRSLYALEVLRQKLINVDMLDMSGVTDGDAFSLVQYREGQRDPVLIEWYDLPHSVGSHMELRSIALERLAKLSVLLSQENKPSTLCAANSIGCVESSHLHRLGLVSLVPDGFSTSKLPVSLHSLVSRQPFPGSSSPPPLPTLSQRFALAATLATSFYTFVLARWHHKMFNSLNIVFMFAGAAADMPDLDRPLVCGYSVSRPSATGEISICGNQTALSENYLHPALLVPANERPRYETKYDIYAFGLLLAEIGFWQPIAKVGAARSQRHGTVPAESLRTRVTRKCDSDLACWMGQQYRDITMRCLHVGENDSAHYMDDLTGFYWNVVWGLVHCSERVKSLNLDA